MDSPQIQNFTQNNDDYQWLYIFVGSVVAGFVLMFYYNKYVKESDEDDEDEEKDEKECPEKECPEKECPEKECPPPSISNDMQFGITLKNDPKKMKKMFGIFKMIIDGFHDSLCSERKIFDKYIQFIKDINDKYKSLEKKGSNRTDDESREYDDMKTFLKELSDGCDPKIVDNIHSKIFLKVKPSKVEGFDDNIVTKTLFAHMGFAMKNKQLIENSSKKIEMDIKNVLSSKSKLLIKEFQNLLCENGQFSVELYIEMLENIRDTFC